MPGFEVREERSGRLQPSHFRVLQALTDAFPRIGAGGNVEEALIGLGVLHDRRRRAFYSKLSGSTSITSAVAGQRRLSAWRRTVSSVSLSALRLAALIRSW